jgi:hypothetical protein
VGVTSTAATDVGGGDVAVMVAVPLLPSLVAIIVTAPADMPDTRPLDETVAIAVFELAHVTTRPVSELPFASFGIAVS